MKLSSEQPLVSIITLCHNQADIVNRAIESVIHQTYPHIQLVIVDDCSTRDNSRAVIREWKDKYPQKIKVHFNEVNQGHPQSMNIGYKLCDGELVTFCDGDDWYFPEKIEREVAFLKANPEVDVVHSNYDFYTVDGTFVRHWSRDEKEIPQGDIYLDLLALRYPFGAHLRYEMTSRQILEETGFYDDRIPIWVDWDLRLRLAAKYKYGYCPYVGSAYTFNPEGLTSVLKQEVILQYLNFVLDKNKDVLASYPKGEAEKAWNEIQRQVQKLQLSVEEKKGSPSIVNTLRFLYRYPSELKDWRFNLTAMFGNKLLQQLSGVKRSVTGNRS